MKVTRLRARNCLSYQNLDLEFGDSITTVTGPNSAGKSNLGQCVAFVSTALGRFAYAVDAARVSDLEQIGYDDATAYSVSLDIMLDQEWEQQLLADFVRAALAYCDQSSSTGTPKPPEIETVMDACLEPDSLKPLYVGTMVVSYDARQRAPWSAAWEFSHEGNWWHIVLQGSNAGQLRSGHAVLDGTFTSGGVATLLGLMRPLLPAGADEDGSALVDEVDKDPSPPALPKFSFIDALPHDGQAVAFNMQSPHDGSLPIVASLRRLGDAVGVREVDRQVIDLTRVFWEILRTGLVVTENRRVKLLRQFPIEDLREPIDLGDGANAPALLHVLKNGDATQRRRFSAIQAVFNQLTGAHLELRSTPGIGEGVSNMLIDPVVVSERGERRITSCGTGRQEALALACLIAEGPGRFLVLDEPAANLEGIGQRRLIAALRRAGQCLLITHSPDLVPTHQDGDLANLVRLAPSPDGTQVFRADSLTALAESRWLRRLEETDARALLFAHTVVLCEGETETAALPRWWSILAEPGLPSLEATHIHFISVGGDAAFGTYIAYLNAFGVKWAIVADGPALAPGSNLDKQLYKFGGLPDGRPEGDEFEDWRAYWRTAGVFTVADTFGNDGSKAGEFEALLTRVNPELYTEAEGLLGRAKPRVGAYFAAREAPPRQVIDLYRDVVDRFGFRAAV